MFVFAAVAAWSMTHLPHGDGPWQALIPGAVLTAVGSQVLHLVVVFYLAPKLGRSSELYGALGAATVILLWLYLIARIFVAGLFLNAARAQARVTRPGPEP